MTQSFATLQIPPQFYNYIRKRLREAGYEHLLQKDRVDMTGIALVMTAGTVKKKKEEV